MRRGLVIATDLDGTLASGDPERRALLLQLLQAVPATRLVYATGRTVDSARTLIVRRSLPEPELLIADVGATVVHGCGHRHVSEVERGIQSVSWPGVAAVGERLAGIAELEAQRIRTTRRASYWITPTRLLRQAAAKDLFGASALDDDSLSAAAGGTAAFFARRAAHALRDLPADVLMSANIYLDVLPRGVNKGTTLMRVLRFLGCDIDACIVAGDSINDHAMFTTGARGIVVANSEPALRAVLGVRPNVYRARESGAGGILEGLQHFGVLPHGGVSSEGRRPAV
ncbi:MAG: HAD-IIB family hydrolase [Gemmatimonadota bacterium]